MIAKYLIVCLALLVFSAESAHSDDINICSNVRGEEGIEACDRLIQSGRLRGRQLAVAHYNRGTLLIRKGGPLQVLLAIVDFNEAIWLHPEYANAYNNRCFARALVNRDLEDALSDCNRALQLRRDFVQALNSRGYVYLRLGRLPEALSDFEQRLRLDPKAASSLYGRGIAKLRNGNRAGGEADIAAAKAINPKIEEEFEEYDITP